MAPRQHHSAKYLALAMPCTLLLSSIEFVATQEACIVLLDVGPQMRDLLEPASKAVSAFIQGKVQHLLT